MDTVNQVNEFISENILHSEVWDNATDIQRKKAVNQSTRSLLRILKSKYPTDEIPIDHIAEQCLWILKIDDMVQRSEMGAKYINVDGISISYSQKDRSVCPYIMQIFNLSEGWNSRRKVGSYSTKLTDSHRKGW